MTRIAHQGTDSESTQKIDSKALFKGTREIKISHNDDEYRLTITKLGKLILTK
ncbi:MULTISPECIES: hemin uptake protein HemP [Pseudovibrio]|uniref:hemin uptake protein HemP n=1 Tax=Stappiaceae TaxID=2821832 RepID=UPI002365C190|nr:MULTISPECIES: hemin uptake protein HemP [Pseudovibrio]MDD7910136.1 hemin uptake protein HemP [Pseudovibrio exalbescens]MDX5592419.1 hemin uptake protein HemP [Pseudovibrio sp. SPO723]